MILKNRSKAGQLLAEKLVDFIDNDTVVLALPRGGVVLGSEISKRFNIPLDIVAVRKIGHPDNPEYAIGAVDSKGYTVLNENETGAVDPLWLRKKIEDERDEAIRRLVKYTEGRKQLTLLGKTIILVDDGIATGFTMRIALKTVKAQHPKKIIIAIPILPQETLNLLKHEGAHEVITLETPLYFLGSVGAYYEDFEQVSDKEVIRLLSK